MADVQRALQIVRLLNSPEDASKIHGLSEELQQIQLSPQGWQVADACLGENDANVKFYGALTFQIKLNKEGPKLDTNSAREILSRIVTWLTALTSSGEKRLVLDKLCSTLSTYFIQSSVKWNKAIRQLVVSLYAGHFVRDDQMGNYPDVSQIFAQLSPEKQLVAIRFCQGLAEDMHSCANLSQQQFQLHESFKTNTADAATILAISFNYAQDYLTNVSVEALGCFTAWVNYGHTTWTTDPVSLELLQALTPLATRYLFSNVDELRDPAIDLFVSILEYRPKFLKQQDLETISDLVRKRIGPFCVNACKAGQQDEDVATLGKLVASYGKATVVDILARRKHESSEELIALFHELLTGPGYPGHDDELIISATDFWSEYAESINDNADGTLTSEVLRDDLMKAVQFYIPKLTPPPREVRQAWDDESFSSWKFFRDNIADFLESVTNVPNTFLLQNLVTVAMQVLQNKQWLELEAVMFCINSISDAINPADEQVAISTLLGSSIFKDVSINADVPVVLKRAVLSAIDGYSTSIKANPAFITPVLTFLFTVLESTPQALEKTADHAAKSFEALCSSCRRVLTLHLGELLQQCPRAISGPSANSYQKEKIMAALASIVQALPADETKVVPLLTLIEVVERDLNGALSLLQSGEHEQGEIVGTNALQCLASIAKGIQAPDQDYIDLDSDEESVPKTDTSASSQIFWTVGPGAEIQRRILACFNIIPFMHPKGGDTIDAACDVLRAGLMELEPGPLVFPPMATVGFVVKGTASTPRIESIISTACTFVSAYSRPKAPHVQEEMLLMYQAVARVMSEVGSPNNDPQLAQLCLDFLHRMLRCYIDVLLAPEDEDIAKVLNFTIESLTAQSPMLKRSACNFFETFIGLARPNNPVPLGPTRVPVLDTLNHVAPFLARSLMDQVCGMAQRSELDSLCKPLRAFIFGVPNAKKYLEEALIESGTAHRLASTIAGLDEKEIRMFLSKIVGLRGGKQTTTVVREFWARCKGTVSRFH